MQITTRIIEYVGVAESADAADLKSVGINPCGFKSRHRHQYGKVCKWSKQRARKPRAVMRKRLRWFKSIPFPPKVSVTSLGLQPSKNAARSETPRNRSCLSRREKAVNGALKDVKYSDTPAVLATDALALISGYSSNGRASPFQGEGYGFDSRYPLQQASNVPSTLQLLRVAMVLPGRNHWAALRHIRSHFQRSKRSA